MKNIDEQYLFEEFKKLSFAVKELGNIFQNEFTEEYLEHLKNSNAFNYFCKENLAVERKLQELGAKGFNFLCKKL